MDNNFYYITKTKRRHKDTGTMEYLIDGKWTSIKKKNDIPNSLLRDN